MGATPHLCAGHPGKQRLDNLRRCFTGTRGRLFEYPVDESHYARLTSVTSHFICFNPLEQNGAPLVFMQLPIPGDEKGWIRLGDEDARRLRMLMERASRSASHDDTDAD